MKLHRAPGPNAKKCESPLLVSCRFGAVTNSESLTGTHRSAHVRVNDAGEINVLRGVARCSSEWLRVPCGTFNPLVGQRHRFAPPSLSRAREVARVRFPAPDAPRRSIRIQYSRAREGVGAPRLTLQRLRSIISQHGFCGLLQFVREKGAVELPALVGPSLLAPSAHGEH